MSEIKVIFFDIGNTLATAHVSPSGRLQLMPLPGVLDVLRKLKESGCRLGIISNTGEDNAEAMRAALEGGGLFDFFAHDPELLIYSSEVDLLKDSPAIFALAVQKAGIDGAHCLYVGEDPDERRFSNQAGLQSEETPAAALVQVLG
jgi:FMN phosphatase YigB (HAD superfamily)